MAAAETAGTAAQPVTGTATGTTEERESPIPAAAETTENEVMADAQPPEKEEPELPQTQMAAAFAAINMDQLASDTPPEETKA